MSKRKTAIWTAVTLLVTVAVCLSLYQWDNKYTQTGVQPIGGLLVLTQAELTDVPIHYLTREWVYWPGRLLTPETVGGQTGYRTVVDVGQTSRLQNQSNHGTGTYCLTLLLPEWESQYALELPEVFSACRLYVNDMPVLSLGEPDPAQYRPSIGTRVVSFSAAGETRILLAVGDQSGVYSGLTYPPAFGAIDAVMRARESRQLIHAAATLLALLSGCLTLCFGHRENRRIRLLGFLCGLCCAGMTVYPLLHSLVLTGYQPWYTLEIGCLYAMLTCAVLLQCQLYGISAKTTWLLTAPCTLGLAAALLRSGGAAWLPAAAGEVFSGLAAALKWYTAACLVGLSLWGARRELRNSLALLCASVSLGGCLALDRLLPLYEPIRGGWFGELGALILTMVLAATCWRSAMDAEWFHRAYQENYRLMEQRLTMQKEHESQLSQQIEQLRQTAHDLRHHMRALRSLTEQDQRERVLEYLDAYATHLDGWQSKVYSQNATADAVLSYYAAAAEKQGAVCDVQLSLPANVPIPDDELCVLLGNLLENAVEALTQQTAGNRKLYLRGDMENGRLRLIVSNSFSGVLRRRGDSFQSTKHEGLGVGVRSVETVVGKYGGLTDFSADNGMFRAMVLIPLEGA